MSRFTPVAAKTFCGMIVATLLATAPAVARAEWAASHTAGTEAAKRGDLSKAKSCFAAAIREAHATGHSEQAARSTIGLANALTHEQQHAAASGVLAIAVKLCDVQGAVAAPTAAALRDSLSIAKSGAGTLDDIERRTAGASTRPAAPTPDASARVGGAPTPDASARSGVMASAIGAFGGAWRPAAAPDAGRTVAAPTPDASARSILQELVKAADAAP